MFELGRIDIITKVLLLSSHVAIHREEHLEAAMHVMAHVSQKYNSRLLHDPLYPEIDQSFFKECDDWSEFYRDAKKAISLNAPEPWGKEADISRFLNSDHIMEWFLDIHKHSVSAVVLKEKSTVETSVFGAEFVAMKQSIYALQGLRYKLRMMGIPTLGPLYIYGDNMSVVHNTSRAESVLRQKRQLSLLSWSLWISCNGWVPSWTYL